MGTVHVDLEMEILANKLKCFVKTTKTTVLLNILVKDFQQHCGFVACSSQQTENKQEVILWTQNKGPASGLQQEHSQWCVPFRNEKTQEL